MRIDRWKITHNTKNDQFSHRVTQRQTIRFWWKNLQQQQQISNAFFPVIDYVRINKQTHFWSIFRPIFHKCTRITFKFGINVKIQRNLNLKICLQWISDITKILQKKTYYQMRLSKKERKWCPQINIFIIHHCFPMFLRWLQLS